MQRILLVFLLLFVAIGACAAQAEDIGVLHLRPLHLVLPPTWTFDGSRNPIEGRGPDGEKLLITIMRRRIDGDSNAPASAKELAAAFAREKMPTLASKGGKVVVRPVEPIPTQEGKLAYAAASEKSGLFGGDQYLVQYLLASDAALIYLTVEGKGKALPVIDRFDAILKTQQWDD